MNDDARIDLHHRDDTPSEVPSNFELAPRQRPFSKIDLFALIIVLVAAGILALLITTHEPILEQNPNLLNQLWTPRIISADDLWSPK